MRNPKSDAFAPQQQTLSQSIRLDGVGLHTGAAVTLRVLPAEVDTGRVFVRRDQNQAVEIQAHVDNVVDTELATTIGIGAASVQTVEHLLAAFQGLGLDNVRVEVDGPEVPALDGSSQEFVRAIRTAGLVAQSAPRRTLVIKKAKTIKEGLAEGRLEPASECSLGCTIEFDHPLVRQQTYRLAVGPQTFEQNIAAARTFGFAEDLDRLRASGFALGGSLENAVLVDPYSVRNPEGLRFADEFVRHKVLDALGDLALFGVQVQGAFTSHRGGHRLNVALVRAVLCDAAAFGFVQAELPDPVAFELGDWATI